MTLQVLPDHPDEQEYSSLHKQATALADEGRMDDAIACLSRAQELLLTCRAGLGHGVDRWVRLPLFLQRAGRLADALSEFEKLLAGLEEFALRSFVSLPDDMARMKAHTFRDMLYRRMARMLEREARRYDKLAAAEESESKKVDKAIARYEKERSQAFAKARNAADRAAALSAFHEKYPSKYR